MNLDPQKNLPPVVNDAVGSAPQSSLPLASGPGWNNASPPGIQHGPPTGTTPAVARQEGIRHNRPLIFGILFGVTGALGLPLLWTSPAFTNKEKWLWSIVNILYTAGLVAIATASVIFIFQALKDL